MQNACAPQNMTVVAITEKLLLDAGGWEALKPARDLHKSGRVAEAQYQPPLLTGLVRAGFNRDPAGCLSFCKDCGLLRS